MPVRFSTPVRFALLALVVLAYAIRLHGLLFEKEGLSNDESISYLCSAATQGRYAVEIAGAKDTTVNAADLQAYYAKPKLNFTQVASDLAHTDRHPPLYFWALHVVHHFFGFHPVDGMALNFLAGLLITLLLFHVVRTVSGSRDLALLVITHYVLSPAVGSMDLEARTMVFLGLFGLASSWLSERIGAGQRGAWTWVAFIAVNCAGLLSHYFFSFLLVPGILMQWRRHGFTRPLYLYLAAILASGIGFLLFFPQVFVFLSMFLHEHQEGSVHGRTWILAYFAWLGFFSRGNHLLEGATLILLGAMAITANWKKAWGKWPSLLHRTDARSYYFWTLVWHIGFTTLFYYLLITPRNCVGGQYFSYIWPLFSWFLVLAMVFLVRRPLNWWLTGALLVVMLLSLRIGTRDAYYLPNVLPADWHVRINRADRLITPVTERGTLPRVALGLRPDLPLHITTALQPDARDTASSQVCILLLKPNDEALARALAIAGHKGPKPTVLQHERLTLVCSGSR